MIVLKNLAREFNADTRRLRAQLRPKFGNKRRWRWDEGNGDDAQELTNIRQFLSTIYGETTTVLPINSPAKAVIALTISTPSPHVNTLATAGSSSHHAGTPKRYGKA